MPKPRPRIVEAKAKAKAKATVLEVSSRSRPVLEEPIPGDKEHYVCRENFL